MGLRLKTFFIRQHIYRYFSGPAFSRTRGTGNVSTTSSQAGAIKSTNGHQPTSFSRCICVSANQLTVLAVFEKCK